MSTEHTDYEERFHALSEIFYEDLSDISDPFQREAIIEQAGFTYPSGVRAVDEVLGNGGQDRLKPLIEFMRDNVSEMYRRKLGSAAIAKYKPATT